MTEQNAMNAPTPSAEAGKPYQPPVLTVFGPVERLTLANGTPPNNDFFGPASSSEGF